MSARKIFLVAMLVACASAGAAEVDQRAEYNRRAAQRDVELFRTLDRNGDGALARDEVRGDLNLGPRFDDIDINRDGIVTAEELQRYVTRRYGVDISPSAR